MKTFANMTPDNERDLYNVIYDIDRKVTRLEAMVQNMQTNQASFVTKSEFEPVKAIVFGLTGLVVTAVIIALLGLVVLRPIL